MRKHLLYLLLLMPFLLQAQSSELEYKRSEILSFEKIGTVDVSKIQDDFLPHLQRIEAPSPGGPSYRSHLKEIKSKIKPTAVSSEPATNKTMADAPIIGRNFEGNLLGGGVPNDNDMAISNDGMLISVVNSNVFITDVNDENYIPQEFSLAEFSQQIGISSGNFDPKVVYDVTEDQFILVFLNGSMSNNTSIIVAFTMFNDPNGIWNVYRIEGNPFEDNTWSDYPIIALTGQELFITINLIQDNVSWQEGFTQSLVWQIFKFSGYNGSADLISRMYSDIYFENKPIRNLMPVQGGADNYGPEIYLLSNRNFDLTNDTIFIMKINSSLFVPEEDVEVSYSLTNTNYGMPPDGRQVGEHTFATNDARILGGYLEDGRIHFVGNTINPETGFAAVYHGMITDLDGAKTVTGNIIGDEVMDFGYPNISYTGIEDEDDHCIISFNYTSPTDFAGCGAVYYADGEYSELVRVKDGTEYVDILGSLNERWGDYSGTQRKYNEPGIVWFNGYFGKPGPNLQFPRISGTWITELVSADAEPVNISEPEVASQLNIYPNPSTDWMEITFELAEHTPMSIDLYDISGKLIKRLLHQVAKGGTNKLSFSVSSLSAGTYIINGTDLNGGAIFEEKMVIAR